MPTEGTLGELVTGTGGIGGGAGLMLLLQRFLSKNGDRAQDVGEGLETALDGLHDKIGQVEGSAVEIAGSQREIVEGQRVVAQRVDAVNATLQRTNELLSEMKGFARGSQR